MDARATLLLPTVARFGVQRVGDATARALGRADCGAAQADGRRAQLLRHFQLIPRHWPVAALTRQHDAGDAGDALWLRADPAFVRPDINGARLLACGGMLQLSAADSAALLPALRPLFGDAGLAFDAPTPARWYLRLPRQAALPDFSAPDDALGSDLFEHLAQGDEGRRWRALLSEAQVLLHNHPWNAQRAAAGKLPVNSLWFWGAGVLPDHVHSTRSAVCSDDETANALAHAAGIAASMPARFALPPGQGDAVFDLPGVRDLAQLDRDWLQPACAAVAAGALARLSLDFADGRQCALTRGQRWRFWRTPVTRLDA